MRGESIKLGGLFVFLLLIVPSVGSRPPVAVTPRGKSFGDHLDQERFILGIGKRLIAEVLN